jgi:hypothetical protein
MGWMGMLGVALALSAPPGGATPARAPLARMGPGAPAAAGPAAMVPDPHPGGRDAPGAAGVLVPKEGGKENAWEGADDWCCDDSGDWDWDILPYPPEVPKLPRRMIEEDPEIRALVDDLDDYRRRFYRNELPLRYGARPKIVKRRMGEPDIRSYPDPVGRTVWWYGDSYVVFKDQRVVGWEEKCQPLAFGLDVAPRHYLPRRAYRDLPPDDQGATILAPGAIGAPAAAAAEAAAAQQSALSSARDAYLSALRTLGANPTDLNARLDAIQKGNAYYATLRGGAITPEDQVQIDRDINTAITAGQLGGP